MRHNEVYKSFDGVDMANVLFRDKNRKEIDDRLVRSFQSGRANFLMGSGASRPAIQTAGDIEHEIDKLFEASKAEEANKKIYELLVDIQAPTNSIITGVPLSQLSNESDTDYQSRLDGLVTTQENYKSFINSLGEMLIRRKTNILRRQANVFTTNYDLFFESASELLPNIRLNDGFCRVPSLTNRAIFSSRNYFNSLYNTGHVYNYQVEIPHVNLIKIHGSLSWKAEGGDLLYHVQERALHTAVTPAEIEKFNKNYSVILPQKGKFRETLLESVYYDLLRLYANELDKEGALLVVFGFSFNDSHIYDLTRRALRNPTLNLMVFAFNESDVENFRAKFRDSNNVQIVSPEAGGVIDFADFNLMLKDVVGAVEKVANEP